MKWLNQLKLKNKIILLVSFLLLSFISLIICYIIPEISRTMDVQAVEQLRNLSETAYSNVEYNYQQFKTGKITEQQAKEISMENIQKLRYSTSGYFWINDYTPRMVMHPVKPELNGTDLNSFKDPSGKKIFVEFVKAVKKKGSGIVYYQWPKPGKDKPQPKMSYVKGFEEWHWVIGTGIYLDDLKETKNNINNIIRGISIILALLIIVSLVFTAITIILLIKT